MTTKIKVGDEIVVKSGEIALGMTGYVSAVPVGGTRYYTVVIPSVGAYPFLPSELRLKNDPEERRFIDALDMVEAKTGSPGLTSWNDGKVGMALSEFERLAGLLPTAKTGPFEKGETVYFLGYAETIAIEKFMRGDVVTIETVDGTKGGHVTSENGSRQWVRWDEISRTKP